ncbi:putative dsdna-binding protein pdcd5 [Venturia nashicola]|uniref:Putative dsdna-binding protein pdcd5 n=1 Tax=Venturia nashicola TaxID=86259 RepID=A0A4Z1NYR4_9PEZI|nr:putative dsdna-binding protein pdcd5 [Venturia nashicola]TLD14752.1 putative dsdna-binding protein pdcd5 [Venturia nashicola]
MADADLEQIRKARLAQLQQASGGAGRGSGGKPSQEEQAEREQEARQAILNQILLPDAADRLGRIRLVKASRATNVENRLIMLARSGQLKSKVTEEQLKDLLSSLSENEALSEQKITVNRRKGGWDDDDDLDDLLNDV